MSSSSEASTNRGRDRSWRRAVVEKTCSTTGALALMLIHICKLREPSPADATAGLHAFLQSRLQGQECEVDTTLDAEYSSAYSAPGTAVPASLCTTLAMDGTRMYVEPFRTHSSGNAHLHLDSLC